MREFTGPKPTGVVRRSDARPSPTTAPARREKPPGTPQPCGGCGTKVLKLAKGAAGVVSATLGISRSRVETIAQRLAICQPCEFRSGDGDVATCSECTCNLVAKTAVAWSECPRQKWGKEPPA